MRRGWGVDRTAGSTGHADLDRDADTSWGAGIGGWVRARYWLAVYVLVALGTVALIPTRPSDDRLADLGVYLGAADTVRSGGPLYDFHAANGDPFTYPPFAVLTFLPLSRLPFLQAAVIWTALSLGAIAALGHLVARHWPRRVDGWLLAAGLLLSAPGQSEVRFGQVSILIVLAVLTDELALPPRWRGALVGLAAAVKLTPLLWVPYYLLTGRRREAAVAASSFVGCTVVGAAVLPGDSLAFWTRAMWATDRVGELTAPGNQSINGMLLRGGVPVAWRPWTWAVLVIIVCGVALVRARRLYRAGDTVRAAVLVGCATVAASPVSWTHHQFWTVLAAMLLIAGQAAAGRVAGVGLLVVMTVDLAWLIGLLAVRLASSVDYLLANLRGLGVVAVCLTGFGALAASASAPPPAAPGGEAVRPHRSTRRSTGTYGVREDARRAGPECPLASSSAGWCRSSGDGRRVADLPGWGPVGGPT